MNRPPERQAGFTLAEMLVALALLSLLSIMALATLSTLRETRRIEQRIGQNDEMESVRQHFRQTFSDIRPTRRISSSGNSSLVFNGKTDAITFTTVLDDQVVTGGLYEVDYRTENGAVLFAYRLIRSEGNEIEWQRLRLLAGADSIQFRYLGAAEEGKTAVWFNSWPAGDRLPSAVEVTVRFGNNRRSWVPLITRVETAQ